MAEDTQYGDRGGLDTSVPHSARIWNLLLGGKDYFPVDRAACDRLCGYFPGMVDMARQSRAFIGRVVRHLTEEAGVRQFLDIGTGLPTQENTHEIAQALAPESRVVYVDNDPLVLAHARALLTSGPEGATDYLDADVRDPATVLHEASRTLDLTRPVGLMLMGIMGLVPDYDEARAVVAELLDALPPGSYLGLNDGTDTDPRYVSAIRVHNARSGAVPYTPRSPEQIRGFFDGLELIRPGVLSCPRWRAGVTAPARWSGESEVAVYGGLARKPARRKPGAATARRYGGTASVVTPLRRVKADPGLRGG